VFLVPAVLHFDVKNKMLRQSYQGRLTDAVLVEGYTRVGGYVAKHPPCKMIVDFSDVTLIEVSSHTVRTLAATPPALPDGCERVVVVPQNALYGLVRMFQILGETSRPNLNIVRTMEAAYQFLGIESAEFSPIDPQDFVEDQSA
jgi:hypothetical protein